MIGERLYKLLSSGSDDTTENSCSNCLTSDDIMVESSILLRRSLEKYDGKGFPDLYVFEYDGDRVSHSEAKEFGQEFSNEVGCQVSIYNREAVSYVPRKDFEEDVERFCDALGWEIVKK